MSLGEFVRIARGSRARAVGSHRARRSDAPSPRVSAVRVANNAKRWRARARAIVVPRCSGSAVVVAGALAVQRDARAAAHGDDRIERVVDRADGGRRGRCRERRRRRRERRARGAAAATRSGGCRRAREGVCVCGAPRVSAPSPRSIDRSIVVIVPPLPPQQEKTIGHARRMALPETNVLFIIHVLGGRPHQETHRSVRRRVLSSSFCVLCV